jgi:hypothetical protein
LSDILTTSENDERARKARNRRARLQVVARERKLMAERREALRKPELAEVRPMVISVTDFRLATGVSNATVFRWLRTGLVKSTRVGGRRLIPLSELNRIQRGG